MYLFFNRKKIKVNVKPYGIIERQIKGGTYELREGAKLRTLLRKSGASGLGIPLIYMIDGERAKPSRLLSDGDEVKILNIVGGG